MVHRIEFATFTEREPWSRGWIEVRDYLTLADRKRLEGAGLRAKGGAAAVAAVSERIATIMRERDVSRSEAQQIVAAEAAEGGDIAGFEFTYDHADAQLAILAIVTEAYSVDGERVERNRHVADALPDWLGLPVLDAVNAHYAAQRLTEGQRKRAEPEDGRPAGAASSAG